MPALIFSNLPPRPPMSLKAEAYARVCVNLSRLAAMTTRTSLDVPYGPDPWQAVDIYRPQADHDHLLPVFLNIHGGAWTHGHKEWMGFGAPPVVAAPAIYVSVSYRLAPEHKYPVALDDCLDALAWVWRNIAWYGGDPDRIFVGGHSAGGQLSSLMALRRDLVARRGLPAGVIKACFPYSGVYDMTYDAGGGRRELVDMCVGLISGTDHAREASPLHWTEGNTIPFHVSWGDIDNPYCLAQAPEFVARLKAQPGRVETLVLPGFDHFWIHLDQQRAENPWTRTLLAWMTGDPETAPVYGM
ncbi:alpha/beta hydrolase [uncultured Alsobacter sp.]|uniref:alpha/beta hydrolase n=1 Tax=uncultured Alsobacter sp. TaxID=1748258 RepID=UPI0025FF470B|nr:alpha/beta hydrolase [uncultured Alsobacter sp.]